MQEKYRKIPYITIYLIYVVGFLDLFGISIRQPLFLSYLKKLGWTPFTSGLISSVYGGVQLFSSPYVGHKSDIYGRSSVLLVCLIFSSLANCLLGFSECIFWIVVARFVLGVAKHTQTLSKTLLADIIPKKDHYRAFGIYNGISSSGFIFGPIAGGYIAEMENGFLIASILHAFFTFISAIICWKWFPRITPNELSQKKSSAHKKVTKSKKSNSWMQLWDILLARFLISFSTLIYRSRFSLIVEEQMNLSPKTIGYLISLQGVVGTLTGFLADKISSYYKNPLLELQHFSWLLVFTFIGFFFSTNIWILVFLLILFSASTSVIRVVGLAVTYSRSSPEQMGTISGIGQTVVSVSRMLSPLTAGVAHELSVFGPGILATVFSTCGISVLGYMSWKDRKLKKD